MSSKKSQRITISGRNLEYLQDLSAQMDEPDLSEVLRYLLTDVRCLGYKIGVKPAPQAASAPLGYSFDLTALESAEPFQECDRNHYSEEPMSEVDANIQRMIDAGMLTMLSEF